MTDRFPRGSRLAIAIAVATAALSSATSSVPAHEAHGHPARIHEGSCEELGAVAFRLNGVGGNVDLDNAPVATPTAVNPDSAYQVMISETTIDATLEDVLAAAHAVMIYESDEAMDAIACGNIGGALHGGTLITGLAEVGVPGHIGFALFQPDGERTSVSVIFGHGLAPISASGTSNGHHHAEGDEAEHPDEEEDAHAAATPAE
jgi:hypothetical protein